MADTGRNPLNYSKWWRDWLTGAEDSAVHAGKLREHLPPEADRFRLMAVEIDRFEELIRDDQWGDKQLVAFAVRNVIQDLLAERLPCSFDYLFASGPQVHYLLTGTGCGPETAEQLIEEVGKWVKISISVGLSELSADFASLPSLHKHAVEALRDKWIRGDGIVCCYEEAVVLGQEASGYPNEFDEAICRAVRGCDREKALEALNEFLRAVKNENASFRLFKRFGLQLLSSVYKIVYENRIHDMVVKEVSQPGDLFSRDFTAEEFRRFMVELIGAVVSSILWNRQLRTNRAIEKAMEYIGNNYGKDISLEDVAGQVHMSGSYFSTFFKQETGDNFVEYLTRLRIDKSKALMINAELRLYEISQMVGYHDVKYFSRLFKRNVGVTPAEYRQFFDRKED